MKITISSLLGYDERRKAQIKQATLFYGRELMNKQCRSRLKIHIEMVSDDALGNTNGAITDEGDTKVLDFEKRPPRKFLIRLRRLAPWWETIYCLAHEMVHVMQSATGILFGIPSAPEATWKGKKFTCDCSRLPYKNRPWEQQAYAKQHALVLAWLTNQT